MIVENNLNLCRKITLSGFENTLRFNTPLNRIVEVFATFPWWHWQQVYHYLREQGLEVSQSQVRQAAQQSGWSKLRQSLVHRYRITASSFRPQDSWLVSELLGQVQLLLQKVESAEGMTPEERTSVADLQMLADSAGIQPMLPIKPLPLPTDSRLRGGLTSDKGRAAEQSC